LRRPPRRAAGSCRARRQPQRRNLRSVADMAPLDSAEGTRRSELVVALGETAYVVRRPWGDLPAGAGQVSDVAVDDRGHVFALLRRDPLGDPPGPGVVELAPDGRRLAMWGEGLIQDGHMFAFAPDGR